MRTRPAGWFLVCVAAACGKSAAPAPPPAAVTGLAAVPADAEVVVRIAPGELAESALVRRGARLLLARDPSLAERWARLAEACAIEPVRDLSEVFLVLDVMATATPDVASTSTAPPSQRAMMVVRGKLDEAALASCLAASVGEGAGQVTASREQGRNVYRLADAGRQLYWAFGQPDTVVVSADRTWLLAALGDAPKLDANASVTSLFGKVDRTKPVWGVGLVAPRIAAVMVPASGGALTAGPRALAFDLDPRGGVTANLHVVMTSEADAKAMESFVEAQLPVLAWAAQWKSAGKLVWQVGHARDGTDLTLSAKLDPTDVNRLLELIDTPPQSNEDAPPNAPPSVGAPK